MTDPDRPPTDCALFEAQVQRVLDRELDAAALDDPHAAACADCRSLAAAAKVLAAYKPPPPPAPVELASRLTDAAVWDFGSRRRRRVVGRAAGAALAASVLVGGFLFFRPTPAAIEVVEVPPRVSPTPTEAPPPRVADKFADAGQALAALTRKATDQTITPTRQLLPPAEAMTFSTGDVPGVEPAAESLAGVSGAARSGLEPMANTTKRALNLFLRDVGIAAPQKPKS
jgi:hypothetical protein